MYFTIGFHEVIHLAPSFIFTVETGATIKDCPFTAYLLNTTEENTVLFFQELKEDSSKSVGKQWWECVDSAWNLWCGLLHKMKWFLKAAKVAVNTSSYKLSGEKSHPFL